MPILFSRMTFGKWKDTRIDDIPSDYLEWCLQTVVDLSQRLRDEMRAVLRERDLRLNGATHSSASPVNASALRREFAAKYHPDRRGGSVEAMQAVNDVFDRLETVLLTEASA